MAKRKTTPAQPDLFALPAAATEWDRAAALTLDVDGEAVTVAYTPDTGWQGHRSFLFRGPSVSATGFRSWAQGELPPTAGEPLADYCTRVARHLAAALRAKGGGR